MAVAAASAAAAAAGAPTMTLCPDNAIMHLVGACARLCLTAHHICRWQLFADLLTDFPRNVHAVISNSS